jgi:hypothetical protein
MSTNATTLGELITVLYDEFMALYGDEELASVAVAATIEDLLTRRPAAWAVDGVGDEEAA